MITSNWPNPSQDLGSFIPMVQREAAAVSSSTTSAHPEVTSQRATAPIAEEAHARIAFNAPFAYMSPVATSRLIWSIHFICALLVDREHEQL